MTPAEKLAMEKAKTPGKVSTSKNVRRVWDCKLRELRLNFNLTQRDVANAIGMSAAGYHQIETCGNDVMLTTAVTLSKFFGKPVDEIWTKK